MVQAQRRESSAKTTEGAAQMAFRSSGNWLNHIIDVNFYMWLWHSILIKGGVLILGMLIHSSM
jgi:hypothetical protein